MLPAMSRHLPRTTLAVVAFALIAAACSSQSGDDTTTTTSTTLAPLTTIADTSSTTTSAPETTTTTEDASAGVSDAINGLPADEALIDRRVVAVKIDNHPQARPQSGLEVADAVYEVLVEGGLTRFIALFHQSDLDVVGPNRSGRPTDAQLIASLAGAPFQVSGAQSWVQSIFARNDINVVYDNGVTTYRVPKRSAPHNLYTSTPAIREWADERGWPDENPGNLFTFGEPTEGGASAETIEVTFSGSPPSTWEWDGEQYLRFQGSEPHMWVNEDGESGQVAFDTVVVFKVREFITPSPGGVGTSLPTADSVGSGEALVFSGGRVIEGTWEREDATDPFTLLDGDGGEIVLAPGRLWMALVPNDEPVTWE
jgi:hypothetical protein